MSFCENLFIEEEADMNQTGIIVTVTIMGWAENSRVLIWHKTGV